MSLSTTVVQCHFIHLFISLTRTTVMTCLESKMNDLTYLPDAADESTGVTDTARLSTWICGVADAQVRVLLKSWLLKCYQRLIRVGS